MGTFTFVTPPEVIEEEETPPEEKGACFKVTVNDEPCFSVSPFQKECFFIKGDEEDEEEVIFPPPELIDLTDLNIHYVYCMHFTSASSLFMLVDMDVDYDADIPIHTVLISASFVANNHGGVQSIEGITSFIDMENLLGRYTHKPRSTSHLARIFGHNNINTGVMALNMVTYVQGSSSNIYKTYLFDAIGGTLTIHHTIPAESPHGTFFAGDGNLVVGTHVNGITSCPDVEPEDQHTKVFFKVMDKYGVITNSDIPAEAYTGTYYRLPIQSYYENIFNGDLITMGNISTGISYPFRMNIGGSIYEYVISNGCYYGHVGEITISDVSQGCSSSTYDGNYIGSRDSIWSLRFRRAYNGEIVKTITVDDVRNTEAYTIASGYVLTVEDDNKIKQTAIYSIID